ncbi:mas-related G-protein coupled receptor member X2-like [Candoia aspera]|uniref:mas-related G-protein coupled receptor member X2-like n=1 Tax=Candoia aspera TaxID=51853 RepID=UPI002FD7C419
MSDNSTDYDFLMDAYIYYQLSDLIVLSIAIFICIFGVVGNGLVTWLLSIHSTSNSFTTYILHLAVADLGTLVFLMVHLILLLVNRYHGLLFYDFSSAIQLRNLFHCTYTAGLCFLTALSAERCLSLLFPVWYQCHRSRRLSSMLSFLIWTLSAMFYGMQISFYMVYHQILIPLHIMFIVNFYFLPSLLGALLLVLLAKICCNSQPLSPGNLNLVLLLSLLCVLLLRGPWTVASSFDDDRQFRKLFVFSQLIFSVNSSAKPVFYYFVGKGMKWSSREPLKIVLQRAFWEETPSRDNLTARNASGVVSC